MSENRPSEERLYRIETQKLSLEKFDCKGWVLDIGGGGEGVIGQLMGEKVIAIDPIERELKEAPKGPLKIVMDARELKFLDETFNTATAFFSFMYIKMCDHEKVLRELHRVIKKDGEFILWDLIIPRYEGGVQDIFVMPLEVAVGEYVIQTGYGTLWNERQQDLKYFEDKGKNAGFSIVASEINGQTLKVVFRK